MNTELYKQYGRWRLRSWLKYRLRRPWTGHLSFRLRHHRVTIYGWNAMHVAVNVWTRRWGYVCFHPTMMGWPWYLYCSRNATPWAATWGIGPGYERPDRNSRLWREVNLRLNPEHAYD